MAVFDLIIVGGGLAGASLAVALRDSRLRIALVEYQPPRRVGGENAGWDARVYALSPANVEFLRTIGVWKHLAAERIAPLRAMQIFGDQGSTLNFSAFETAVPDLGCILESSLMACELWESLKRQSNVQLFLGQKPVVQRIDADTASLHLADGSILAARLLVGADGRDSWVRETAGLSAHNRPYGEKGVVANFACAEPHHNTAWQWFRADGVLAWLPLAGQNISMVWSAPDALAEELLQLSPQALAARVAAAGGHRLGELQCITPAQAFPLRLMRVPRTVAPRLALVGDAAHGIHPLSGHGINLGFQDARELAERLLAAPAWQDIGELRFLSAYQRARREETVLMQSTTDSLRRLFASPSPLLKNLRNLGLELTERLPVAKTVLVRYALGAL